MTAQESWGSELHPDLKVHPKARVIHKGINPEVDSYSAFFDNAKMGKTSLEEIIKDEEVVDLYICGIATDVCVGELGPRRISERGKRKIIPGIVMIKASTFARKLFSCTCLPNTSK